MSNHETVIKKDLSRIDEREDEIEAEKGNRLLETNGLGDLSPIQHSKDNNLSKRINDATSNNFSSILKAPNNKTFSDPSLIEKLNKKDGQYTLSEYGNLPTALEPDFDLDDDNSEMNHKSNQKSKKNIPEFPFTSQSTKIKTNGNVLDDISEPTSLAITQDENPNNKLKNENKTTSSLNNAKKTRGKVSSSLPKKVNIVDSDRNSLTKFINLKIAKDQTRYSVKELGDQIKEAANRRSYSSVDWYKIRPAILDEKTFEPLEESDEAAEVKDLDRWQLENRERKLIEMYGQKDDIYQQAQYLKSKENEKIDRKLLDPKINNKLINYIMDDDIENQRNIESRFDNRTKSSFKKTEFNDICDESDSFTNADQNFDKRPLQGIETVKREYNKEIINELILRKIKQIMPGFEDFDTDTENFRLKVKSIAEKVLGHFSSLKGFSAITVLNSHIEHLIKKLKKKKTIHEELFAKTNYLSDNIENQPDYKAFEGLLLRKHEDAILFIQDLREKYKAQTQILLDNKNLIKQLYRERDDKEAYFNREEARVTKNKQDKRKGAGRRVTVNMSDMLEEQLQLNKLRSERSKIQQDLLEKIKKIEENIRQSNTIIANIEEDLAKCKNKKNVFKIQLRDLYYKILKDDLEVLKKDNDLNYVCALKSIINLNEEVNTALLPNFLDKESAEYIIEYAKIENELEKFCKENDLTGLLTLQNDILNHKDVHKHYNELNFSKTFSKISKIHVKDYPEMLYDVKERLNQLKNQNYVSKIDNFEKTKTNTIDSDMKTLDESPNLGRRLIPSKSIKLAVKEDNSKIDKVLEMISRLDKIKKAEINRLVRTIYQKKIDDRVQLQFQKSTRFLFGKKEGQEIFKNFLKEKKMIDQKAQKSTTAGGGNRNIEKFIDHSTNTSLMTSKLGNTGPNETKDLMFESGSLLRFSSTIDINKNNACLPQIRDSMTQSTHKRSVSLNNSRVSVSQSHLMQQQQQQLIDPNQLPNIFSNIFSTIRLAN